MYTVSFKLLLYIHVLNKIQVDVIWHIHLNPFYKMRRINCNVKVSCKTERLDVSWYESKVNASFAFNRNCVLEIVSVICRGVVGEWADKFIS